MPLVPLRPVLDAAVQYGYAQGAFNVNAVAQAEAVIAVHEMFRSPVILQGADLANAFMGGRTDFQNGTLEDKKRGAKNIADAVRRTKRRVQKILPKRQRSLLLRLQFPWCFTWTTVRISTPVLPRLKADTLL